MRTTVGQEIRRYLLIALAIFSAGMGIKGYLKSSHFIDGGVTGISMLLNYILEVPLAILIPVINLPFIYLGYRQMGFRFAIRSCVAIGGLAVVLELVNFPDVTKDLLLTSVFGGFFIGLAIGLAIRAEAVLDGTEIAALLLSKNFRVLKVADVILLFNIGIFGAAAFFLGVERASYSILTYFAASKTIDFILNGLEEHTGVTIISRKSEAVRSMIIKRLGRGVTVYKGKQGYGKRGESEMDHDILFTVITRLEVGKLIMHVKNIDPDAFVFQHTINDIHGGMVKQRGLH